MVLYTVLPLRPRQIHQTSQGYPQCPVADRLNSQLEVDRPKNLHLCLNFNPSITVNGRTEFLRKKICVSRYVQNGVFRFKLAEAHLRPAAKSFYNS